MTNVIALPVSPRFLPQEARLTALLTTFAQQRRRTDDVFWMKENAELLNILECTNSRLAPEALLVHREFYADAEKRLQFFPQYYRFILSMVLDLEELGLPGDIGERLARFAQRHDLPGAELSDLQRAEARRLLSRRGFELRDDTGLDDRLRRFAMRTATFALPNKKAAYELTHIVFYLSGYGRRDPGLDPAVIQSLHFAGLTAFLDRNADLLAEICIALVYLGQVVPRIWRVWLREQTQSFHAQTSEGGPMADHYHSFFVCNWQASVLGDEMFALPLHSDATRFFHHGQASTALREVSQALLALDWARSGDFDQMRQRIAPHLSRDAQDTLSLASESSVHFEAFFEGFARVGQP